MSGTPVVRAQLNAVNIWILDFEILESDVVSFSIEGNAIFLIQRINIDAIKNHILDRGGGDSDINFSLEDHLFAIERGDFDGITPGGAGAKFGSYVGTAIQAFRIGPSADIEGIAGFEQTDPTVDGAEGRGLRSCIGIVPGRRDVIG